MLQKPVDMSATFWMAFSLCTGHLLHSLIALNCDQRKVDTHPCNYWVALVLDCVFSVWFGTIHVHLLKLTFCKTGAICIFSRPLVFFFPLTLQAIMPHLAFASHSVWTHFYFQLTVHKARSTKKCFLTLLWKNLTSLHKTPTMSNQTIYPTSQHWIEVPMPGVGSSIIKPSCVLIFSKSCSIIPLSVYRCRIRIDDEW